MGLSGLTCPGCCTTTTPCTPQRLTVLGAIGCSNAALPYSITIRNPDGSVLYSGTPPPSGVALTPATVGSYTYAIDGWSDTRYALTSPSSGTVAIACSGVSGAPLSVTLTPTFAPASPYCCKGGILGGCPADPLWDTSKTLTLTSFAGAVTLTKLPDDPSLGIYGCWGGLAPGVTIPNYDTFRCFSATAPCPVDDHTEKQHTVDIYFVAKCCAGHEGGLLVPDLAAFVGGCSPGMKVDWPGLAAAGVLASPDPNSIGGSCAPVAITGNFVLPSTGGAGYPFGCFANVDGSLPFTLTE